LQTAPPIFGWAAITFGIGPHSIVKDILYRSVSNDTFRNYAAGTEYMHSEVKITIAKAKKA